MRNQLLLQSWPKLDSNQRPCTYQVHALPTKLLDHMIKTFTHYNAKAYSSRTSTPFYLQTQVPLQLPCYDFAAVPNFRVIGSQSQTTNY